MKTNPETERFFYRVAGIFIRDAKVLMHQDSKEDFWVLPGGACEFGEDSESALRREMREELNTEIEFLSLVWIVENFFHLGKRKCHEIGMYYRADLPLNPLAVHEKDEFLADEHFPQFHESKSVSFKMRFRWIPFSEIGQIEIKPAFLKTAILKIPSQTLRIVHEESAAT